DLHLEWEPGLTDWNEPFRNRLSAQQAPRLKNRSRTKLCKPRPGCLSAATCFFACCALSSSSPSLAGTCSSISLPPTTPHRGRSAVGRNRPTQPRPARDERTAEYSRK